MSKKELLKTIDSQMSIIADLKIQLENPTSKEQIEKLEKEKEDNEEIIKKAKEQIAKTEKDILGGVDPTPLSEKARNEIRETVKGILNGK